MSGFPQTLSSCAPAGVASNCGSTLLSTSGCAQGVGYTQFDPINPVTGERGDPSWFNLNTGEFTSERPLGFVTGPCAGGQLASNRYARFVLPLTAPIQVSNGEQVLITPTIEQFNNFPAGMLRINDSGKFILANTSQLNLLIRVTAQFAAGAFTAYDLALQRGNETTLIEPTKVQVFRRADQGSATGGTSSALIKTFSSGPTDPFNNAGFDVAFFNPSGTNATLELGNAETVRYDVFGVV